MNPTLTIAITLAAALATWALTPVITAYVPKTSPFVRSKLHIILAAAGTYGATLLTNNPAILAALTAATIGSALLVTIDFAVHRLPNKPVATTAATTLVALGIAAATSSGWNNLGRAALAALILVTAYFILALISPEGIGLGDVKYASVIGITLGWFGWAPVAVGTVLAFLINGLFALAMLIRNRKAKGSEVPFGPSMALGAVIALALHA